MLSAYWWLDNELGHLAADPDGGGLERRGAVAVEGGHQAALTLYRIQSGHLEQQHSDSVQEHPVLDRHALLCRQHLRVARRPFQSAGEHRLSHAVVGLCGGGLCIGAMVGRNFVACKGAGHCTHLRRRCPSVQECGMKPLSIKPVATKPFLPFARPSIGADSIAAVAEVFRSGQLASGPKVLAFEAALIAYLGGNRQVRVMTSATAGLEMALEVASIGEGDEVIVPAMSFAASANVVARLRAVPKFVDIDLLTRNIDLNQVPAVITPKTRAIMPVHFAGLPVDMDALYGLASQHNLRVVEDAAHAIGSSYRDKPIGSFGDLVVFSFHPNKNMTTIEGGAVSSADAATAQLLEQYRFHGIKRNAAGE